MEAKYFMNSNEISCQTAIRVQRSLERGTRERGKGEGEERGALLRERRGEKATL